MTGSARQPDWMLFYERAAKLGAFQPSRAEPSAEAPATEPPSFAPQPAPPNRPRRKPKRA